MTIIDNWFATAVGTKMDPDGHYGLQCVDVIDHYAEYIFGVRWQDSVGGVAGAKDLLDRAPDEYWTRIDYYHGFVPQYGDVLVFAGDGYNIWGHTAVTMKATISRITAVQQDGFAQPSRWVDGNFYSDKPVHVYNLNYSQNGTGRLAGVLRPKLHKLKGYIVPQSTPEPPKEWDEMASKEDFKAAIREVIAEPETLDKIAMAVITRPFWIVDPATGELSGKTSDLRTKGRWEAYLWQTQGTILHELSKKFDIHHPPILDITELEEKEEPVVAPDTVVASDTVVS